MTLQPTCEIVSFTNILCKGLRTLHSKDYNLYVYKEK